MCGYVLEDETYISTGLIGVVQKGVIFQTQKAALRRSKGIKIE